VQMFKRFVAMILAITCCLAATTTTFAMEHSDTERFQETSKSSIQPYADKLLANAYVGIYPQNGTNWHFGMQTAKATGLFKQYKAVITTSDFKSDTYVAVQINNSKGVSLMEQVFAVYGNRTATIKLSTPNYINGDTLDVWWQVHSAADVTVGDTGHISIKIYSY